MLVWNRNFRYIREVFARPLSKELRAAAKKKARVSAGNTSGQYAHPLCGLSFLFVVKYNKFVRNPNSRTCLCWLYVAREALTGAVYAYQTTKAAY